MKTRKYLQVQFTNNGQVYEYLPKTFRRRYNLTQEQLQQAIAKGELRSKGTSCKLLGIITKETQPLAYRYQNGKAVRVIDASDSL